MADSSDTRAWALILGASSGFGAATARALARAGFDVLGVHLDRKATMPLVEEAIAGVREEGREALFFNVNAADQDKRKEVLDAVAARFAEDRSKDGRPGTVRVLLHSLAFGTLKPYVAASLDDELTKAQMDMTLDVMAHSLVYWVQDLVRRALMTSGGRVFAMTSAGGHRVWATYGAVSAAKAALESHIRQLALELAPKGIAANCVRAGVTDTPALRKIPGHDKMIEKARASNPFGRLTTTSDVARAIAALAHPDLGYMTGNVIGVDGGEDNTQ